VNVDTAYYRRICADRCALSHPRLDQIVRCHFSEGPRLEIVSKDGGGAYEYIILDGNAVPDGNVILYRNPVSYPYPALYIAALADIAVPADDRTRQYVHISPHPGSFTNVFGLNHRIFMDENFSLTHVRLLLLA
jgi:hypothetical protein